MTDERNSAQWDEITVLNKNIKDRNNSSSKLGRKILGLISLY